jgi:hypothetical protein
MSAQEPGPGELTVLTWLSNNKPAATFTSVTAMRTWLTLAIPSRVYPEERN